MPVLPPHCNGRNMFWLDPPYGTKCVLISSYFSQFIFIKLSIYLAINSGGNELGLLLYLCVSVLLLFLLLQKCFKLALTDIFGNLYWANTTLTKLQLTLTSLAFIFSHVSCHQVFDIHTPFSSVMVFTTYSAKMLAHCHDLVTPVLVVLITSQNVLC